MQEGSHGIVNPLGNATARGQMTRALVANISVQWHFLWDDFWPSNGQIMPWGRGLERGVNFLLSPEPVLHPGEVLFPFLTGLFLLRETTFK